MPIPLILASKSKPRRDVLYSAGICPTIRVSHVDEPAALEAAAREEGVTVDDLSIKQRVMILPRPRPRPFIVRIVMWPILPPLRPVTA